MLSVCSLPLYIYLPFYLLLQACMYVSVYTHIHICAYAVCCLVSKSCQILLQPHGLLPTRILCPWDFPGKNSGVDCHFLLQGIFPTKGLNLYLLCLLHCR